MTSRLWWIGSAVLLASCRREPYVGTTPPVDAGSEVPPMPTAPAASGHNQETEPYSGYPGPVGRLDAGAAGADAGKTPTEDGGIAPPSTAMPGSRPLYPDAGDAGQGGGGRRPRR